MTDQLYSRSPILRVDRRYDRTHAKTAGILSSNTHGLREIIEAEVLEAEMIEHRRLPGR